MKNLERAKTLLSNYFSSSLIIRDVLINENQTGLEEHYPEILLESTWDILGLDYSREEVFYLIKPIETKLFKMFCKGKDFSGIYEFSEEQTNLITSEVEEILDGLQVFN